MNVAVLAVCAGLVLLANRRADLADLAADLDLPGLLEIDPSADTEEEEEATQGGFIDWLAVLDPLTYVPAMTSADTQEANVRAFLMVIRKAEGTAGPEGYRTMFGYRRFHSWADHPRDPIQFTDGRGRRLWTSAAGAYQFMAVSPLPGGGTTRSNTWDRMADKLGLLDFSPMSQDRAAIELIREKGALEDVRAGRFDAAISKVRSVWASLPGAGYSQPERNLADLRAAFTNAGGRLA